MSELSPNQKKILSLFYAQKPTHVVYGKKERKKIWDKAKANLLSSREFADIQAKCPAFAHQIKRSRTSGDNIQSAVFSECAYAQTIANMFSLSEFIIYDDNPYFLPWEVTVLLKTNNLNPRFIYASKDKRKMLVQAGGCGGIDSALISIDISNQPIDMYTIEFKEPYAKTSEPDLPKFGEDGKIDPNGAQHDGYLIFIHQYPQFKDMLDEHINLDYFSILGENIHDFKLSNILKSVNTNYSSGYKSADVICTEDKKGYLLIVPADFVTKWAKVEGEIRSAGRNHYKVWTPNRLRNFLLQKGATISANVITIDCDKLQERKERGGNNIVSGYKINPLFFVYLQDCTINGSKVEFNLDAVQELNPTIAGKVDFRKSGYDQVMKDITDYLKNS